MSLRKTKAAEKGDTGKMKRSDSVKTVTLQKDQGNKEENNQENAKSAEDGTKNQRKETGNKTEKTHFGAEVNGNIKDEETDVNKNEMKEEGKDGAGERTVTLYGGKRNNLAQSRTQAGKTPKKSSGKTYSEQKQPKNYRIVKNDSTAESIPEKEEDLNGEVMKSQSEVQDGDEDFDMKGFQYNDEEERFDQITDEWGDGEEVSFHKIDHII